MRRMLVFLFAVTLATATIWSQQRGSEREALIARGKLLEINTPYVPPPGDALEHHTSGFAKIMCSAVFITGLEYMASLTGKAIEFYSCFISYSTKDQEFADRLYADLQSKGVRCWFAQKDLKIGDEFRQRIHDSIRLHEKLLVILSESSIASPWVQDEVETADRPPESRLRTTIASAVDNPGVLRISVHLSIV